MRTAFRQHAGFTLIELLIVVAILSIMVTASMQMIVSPMRESNLATLEQAQQAGISTLLARLVEEAHTASTLRPVEKGIVLEKALAGGASVAYQVDAHGVLRRQIGDNATSTGATLLTHVTAFEAAAETTATLWTLTIQAKENRYGFPVETKRRITLAVGGQS